jgi:mutator protein MutT
MHRMIDVVIGIVVRGGAVLICQRPAEAVLGGYWEFPGGKRETGETVTQCLTRELNEELAIEVQPIVAFDPIEYQYPDRRIRLHPYLCILKSGEPKALASQCVKWIEPTCLRDYAFPPANERLIEDIIRHLTAPAKNP